MKKLMGLIIVAIAVGFFLPSGMVFAASGGANQGTSPVGGGCNYSSYEDWWDECFGYSWQAYIVTNDLPSSNTVTFHYTTETGGAVYLHYCKKGQTIYNYGFEVHNGSNSAGTQVSTQSNKNGTQARWRDGGVALGAYGGYLNTTGSYLRADHYETANYVKEKYQKMVEYDKNHGTNFTHGTTWENVGYFCFDPGAEEATLTLKSVDVNGNSLASVANLADKTVKVKINSFGTIKRNTASGYNYLGYKQDAPNTAGWNGRAVLPNGNVLFCGNNNQPTNGDASCVTSDSFVRKMTANYTVYAIYEKNIVEGKSDVVTNSTGWQRVDKIADTYWIENCSPVDGCNVTFEHSLRRQSGVGNSAYTIKRESNYWDESRQLGVESKDPLKGGTETFPNGNGKAVVENTETLTLYPGQKVCEIMTFDSAPGLKDKATLKVCAGAKGDAQPGDEVLLDIKVKNDSVNKYNNYADVVYAKPGDDLTYKATYHPRLQFAFNLVPEAIKIDGGNKIANNNGLTMERLFNDNNGTMQDWKNAFSVESSGLLTEYKKNFPYTIGDTTGREEFNSYSLTKNDAGKSLNETAKINANNDTKTTPSKIFFVNDGDTLVGNIATDAVDDIAKAIAPYNYKNSTNITKPTASAIVFAGENENVDYDVVVDKKYNGLLEDEYATIVRNSKRKIELCYNNWADCQESTFKTENLNDSKYNREGSSVSETINIVIPDVPAGSRVWIRSAVYPKDSGPDDNINAEYYDVSDATSWAYSDWIELIVAKKPSLQVWGGNVYSADVLNVPFAAKLHVDGFGDGYNINKNIGYYVFGSWTELSLVSLKENTGFGSGASMGYVSNSGGVLSPSYNSFNPDGLNPGGSLETSLNFCVRSVLTFANTTSGTSLMCKDKTPGLGASGSGTAENNKSSLIARFVNATPEEREQRHIVYEEYDDYTIGGTVIPKGTTRVIKAGKITVGGDIYYEDNYSTLRQIPKLIIYADDIDINCNVNRIDAVLIAEGSVNTCANSEDTNSSANSRQLIINGSIITDILEANRTYGAASGSNSIIPAEIVNYDATLYLWSSNKADVSNSGRLMETYTHELSPRY